MSSFSHDAAVAFDALIQHLQTGHHGEPWCEIFTRSLKERRQFAGHAIAPPEAEYTLDRVLDDTIAAFRSLVDADSLTVVSLDRIEFGLPEHAVREAALRRGVSFGVFGPDRRMRALTKSSGRPFELPWQFISVRSAIEEDLLFYDESPVLEGALHRGLKLK